MRVVLEYTQAGHLGIYPAVCTSKRGDEQAFITTPNVSFWHKVKIQRISGNGRTTALVDPVQLGKGGISASQIADLLPTERVLLCRTLGSQEPTWMYLRRVCVVVDRAVWVPQSF